MSQKLSIATAAGTSQKLTAPKKHVAFRAKVSRMGDKIHIIIPKAYHRDIEKQNLVDEYVDVDVSKEVNGQ
jgi:hypothetical protein